MRDVADTGHEHPLIGPMTSGSRTCRAGSSANASYPRCSSAWRAPARPRLPGWWPVPHAARSWRDRQAGRALHRPGAIALYEGGRQGRPLAARRARRAATDPRSRGPPHRAVGGLRCGCDGRCRGRGDCIGRRAPARASNVTLRGRGVRGQVAVEHRQGGLRVAQHDARPAAGHLRRSGRRIQASWPGRWPVAALPHLVAHLGHGGTFVVG